MATSDYSRSITSLFIWGVESFADHWSPTDDQNRWPTVTIHDVPPRASRDVFLSRPTHLVLSPHMSPVHEGMYRLWMYATDPHNSTSCCFTFCPPRYGQPLCLCLRHVETASRNIDANREITYAGHSIHSGLLVSSMPQPALADPDARLGVELPVPYARYLSAYSGAAISITLDYIIVTYYK